MEMDNDEFLTYCDTHADILRCGFVPVQIARLCRLAGHDESAAEWDQQPHGVYDMNHGAVQATVKIARDRLAGGVA